MITEALGGAKTPEVELSLAELLSKLDAEGKLTEAEYRHVTAPPSPRICQCCRDQGRNLLQSAHQAIEGSTACREHTRASLKDLWPVHDRVA